MRRAHAIIIALVLTLASTARAEEAVGEGPRVFSIQPRPYKLGHEFQLGLGVLPMDAYYVGAVIMASYTYHFTDFWGWEIAGAGYSRNFNTSLKHDLKTEYGVVPVQGGGDRIQYFGTTSLVIKPFFGKLAIFNQDMVTSETYFVLGLGALQMGPEGGAAYARFVADVGLGLRLWSSDTLSMRVDVRDYLIFVSAVPQQALFLSLSVAFNFHLWAPEQKAQQAGVKP
jgi:outer membrane beta-barrel protein